MSDQFNTPSVVYKEIPGFPGRRVGTDGSVWSCWSRHGCAARWRRLRPSVDRDGYHYVRLSIDGKRKRRFRVHRLVLSLFSGSPPDGHLARHLNGVRSDNRLENLVWGTCAENHEDQIAHGTLPFGEKNPKAKLTLADVQDIRRRLARGEKQEDVACLYGVKQAAVSKIKLRKTWSHSACEDCESDDEDDYDPDEDC